MAAPGPDGGGAVLSARPTVLLAAAGAAWEAGAVSALTRAGVVIAKRCVDVTDLIATSAGAVADVAVVAGDLPGLDADVVRQLTSHHTGILAIAEAEVVERVRRIGIAEVLVDPEGDEIAQQVRAQATRRLSAPVTSESGAGDVGGGERPDRAEEVLTEGPDGLDGGRVVVVWGAHGAPGRTTVATAIAAERAAAGRRVVLIDADPYGGAIGQNLGVLDEISGLLAAARAVNEGTLTTDSLARCRRALDSGLEVLTGLPRPDRWTEVRPGAIARIVELSALHADVVVDVGFGLADDRHQGRDRITLEALDCADEVVAVGGAEPVSLVRLARGLVDLAERGTTPSMVVVNRMRDSLGWTRKDLASMVAGYVWDAEVRFVRDERDTLDKSLATGRALAELGESRLRADLAAVTATVFGSRPEEQV